MESWGLGRRALMGTVWGIGLGCIAGAIETVALAPSEKLALGMVGFFGVGLTAAVVMCIFAAAMGIITAPVHVIARGRASTGLAIHLGLIGFLLCGFYLWQGAWTIYDEARAIGAFALAAMPLGFAGVIYFNARFFLRRMEIDKPIPVPWLPVAAFAGLGFIGLSAVFFGLRDTGGAFALKDDKNVVIVMVDGWTDATLPLDGATHFDNIVSPTPQSRPAAATILTGWSPFRHWVISPDRSLSYAHVTLPELLIAEDHATGAFVSSLALNGDSGLEQGFKVYDDDFSPMLPGVFRVTLLKWLAPVVASGRSSASTVDRFGSWLDTKKAVPFTAFVHLADASDIGEQIGRIDTLLGDAGVAEETLLLVIGSHGAGPMSLKDDRIVVPAVVRAPGIPVKETHISQQLRLMDVFGTALAYLDIKGHETESLDLLKYVKGEMTATVWCGLVGETEAGMRIGLRNNGVKYLKATEGNADWLFHVTNDPGETTDVKESQPEVLERARQMLFSEEVALEKILR